tara:strand:- start:208 stop:1251 length:1044 start_codon:yes stop_codon:yes gene_type:complete
MSNIQINPYAFGGGAVGAWKELDRTTLLSGNSAIDVSGLPNKEYYMFLCDFRSTVNAEPSLRINADSGNYYARRASTDGGTDSTDNTQDQLYNFNQSLNGHEGFTMGYISNLSAKEKLLQWSWVTNRAGTSSTSLPNRQNAVAKWANTSSSLSSFNTFDSSGDNFSTGSEVVILGYDSTDTHTTADNFWKELANVDLSGGAATNIDSGTITAKKYLWFQFYGDSITSANSIRVTFNGDVGGNYADRSSQNGGAEDTNTSTNNMQMTISTHTTPSFINCFAINNSANEKLVINHSIDQNTAGSGNVPTRVEGVHKWSCEPCQITSINFKTSGGANLGTNTMLKVWGSD